jgi:transcription elongation factor GreB
VYRIVGVDEADPARGQLSWIAPLARALLGHRAGEEAVLKLPDRAERVQIIKVEFK